MNYADLYIGRVVQNRHTGEQARIDERTDKGLVVVGIKTGPFAGDRVPLHPADVLTHWDAVN